MGYLSLAARERLPFLLFVGESQIFSLEALSFSHEMLACLVVKSQGPVLFAIKNVFLSDLWMPWWCRDADEQAGRPAG